MRVEYSPLLTSWATAGYVVAEVNFPLTNCAVPGGAHESDIVNQPADLRFVISTLLAYSTEPGRSLRGLLNPDAVAVAGHSDGGDSAVAVAANSCCRDPRIKAAVILAGAELSGLAGSYFPPGSPPILFVQGSADPVNVPADTDRLYDADQAGEKYLLSLTGASHFTPYNSTDPSEATVARVSVDFLDRWLRHDAAAALSLTRDANVAGPATLSESPGAAARAPGTGLRGARPPG